MEDIPEVVPAAQVLVEGCGHVRKTVEVEPALAQGANEFDGVRFFKQIAARGLDYGSEDVARLPGGSLQARQQFGFRELAAVEQTPLVTKDTGSELPAQFRLRLDWREHIIRVPLQHHPAEIHDHIANCTHVPSCHILHYLTMNWSRR